MSDNNQAPINENIEPEAILDNPETKDELEVEATPEAPRVNYVVSKDPRIGKPEADANPTPIAQASYEQIYNLAKGSFIKQLNARATKGDATAEENQLLSDLADTASYADSDGVLQEAANKAGNLVQGVPHETGELRISVPRYKPTGGTMSSNASLALFASAIGQGTYIKVPLYTSGIWTTLRMPTTLELADIRDKINLESITLGALVNGETNSLGNVHATNHLMDLIETLVHQTSVTEINENRVKLRSVLHMADFNVLLWTLGSGMYPNGYPLSDRCLIDPEKCTHVNETLVNLSRMMFTDMSRLSAKQVGFMASSRIKPVTLDKVKEYQDAADWFESKPYPLNDQLTIIFEHPTVEKFIDTGIQWLMDLENGVRKVLGDPDEVTLNRAIMNRHQLIVMRRYSHYIKKFVYPNHRDENDNPIEITEQSHLLATAEQLSGNLELVEVATKAVRDYIASNTLTVFGQPLYECGKCKKVAPAADPNYPTIHTVNPIEVFMDLQYRKLSQV